MLLIVRTISFLLFLGTARLSISENYGENDSTISSRNFRKNSDSFVLVNPNQVQYLERTLRRFLSKMAVPPRGPLVLRSSKENDLQLTIREICDSMRKKFVQFAKDCQLMTTVQRYKQYPNDVPLSENWFSEILLQGSYVLRDLGNMINEIRDEIFFYFGKPNITSQVTPIQHLTRQADSFQFLGTVYNAADFGERLSQCLLRMESERRYKATFYLNRAVLDLTKYPPNVALRIFKSNMVNASLDTLPNARGRHKSWHVFLCFSMVKEEGVRYNDCIRDLQSLDACLRSLKQRSAKKPNDAEVKSWIMAIQRLSDCQIQEDKEGTVQISCKSSHRMPRNIKQKVKYLFESMLDRKISRRSALHRAVGDLSDTLKESNWGQKFVEELCQYFVIYEDGVRKLQRQASLAARDKKAMRRYKEIFSALETYKRGILLRSFKTIGKIHRSAVEFEKLLVNGIKTTLNEAWQGHVRIMSCMMDWMTKLLNLYGGVENNEDEKHSTNTDTEVVEWNKSENLNSEEDFASDSQQTMSRSKIGDNRREADAAMNGLMESMNHLTKHRSANDKSMLASLANNILLATMFVETIGFISTLFCLGEPAKNEHDEKWNRTRRSLLSLHHRGDTDPILEDYLLLRI